MNTTPESQPLLPDAHSPAKAVVLDATGTAVRQQSDTSVGTFGAATAYEALSWEEKRAPMYEGRSE